jgi:hypothetical protein
MRKETILRARKKILKDSLLLLFGEFPFFANLIMIVVGHGGREKDWAEAKRIYIGQLLHDTSD